MNNRVDLSELVSIVAEQTQLDISIVEHFISQLFKEIETELITNSVAKIPGLGTFKVVKGSISSTSRIIFIADFRRLRTSVSGSTRSGSVTKETVSRFEKERQVEEPEIQKETEKPEDKFVEEEIVSEENFSENLIPDVVEDITPTFLVADSEVLNEKDGDAVNDTVIENKDAETQDEDQRLKRIKNEHVIVSKGKGLDFDEDLNFKLEQNVKKKNRKVWIGFGALLLLLGLIIGVYTFYVSPTSIEEPAIPVVAEDEKPTFEPLENSDPGNYVAIVMPLKRVNIQKVSEFFYKDKVYWPYIFQANKDNIENILDIHPETILKIPRIDSVLEEKDAGKKAARDLGSRLLSEIETRKKQN